MGEVELKTRQTRQTHQKETERDARHRRKSTRHNTRQHKTQHETERRRILRIPPGGYMEKTKKNRTQKDIKNSTRGIYGGNKENRTQRTDARDGRTRLDAQDRGTRSGSITHRRRTEQTRRYNTGQHRRRTA